MTRLRADLILFGCTIILGLTFVIVKVVLGGMGPLTFLALRFGLAAVVLLLIFRGQLWPLQLETLRAGLILGVFLAAGFATQTIGMQYTPAGKSAFITGLNVALVPLFAAVWIGDRPSGAAVAGISLATVGLYFLCVTDEFSLREGDLWILACAVAYALHIVGVSRYARHVVTAQLNFVQIVVVAVFCAAAAPLAEKIELAHSAEIWMAVVFMGVVATALILALQIAAQRHTTATHAALLFSLEPVFAAVFAGILLDEAFSATQSVGAVLILCGMLIAEAGLLFTARRSAVDVNEPVPRG